MAATEECRGNWGDEVGRRITTSCRSDASSVEVTSGGKMDKREKPMSRDRFFPTFPPRPHNTRSASCDSDT